MCVRSVFLKSSRLQLLFAAKHFHGRRIPNLCSHAGQVCLFLGRRGLLKRHHQNVAVSCIECDFINHCKPIFTLKRLARSARVSQVSASAQLVFLPTLIHAGEEANGLATFPLAHKQGPPPQYVTPTPSG